MLKAQEIDKQMPTTGMRLTAQMMEEPIRGRRMTRTLQVRTQEEARALQRMEAMIKTRLGNARRLAAFAWRSSKRTEKV